MQTIDWLDPLDPATPPPRGNTIQLLTDQEIPVYGKWKDKGYVAWAPLPVRQPWIGQRIRERRGNG